MKKRDITVVLVLSFQNIGRLPFIFAILEDLVQKAKTNIIDDLRLAFEKVFINKVIDRMDQNQAFFTRVLDDKQFKNALMEYMLVETYEKLNSIAK